MRIVEEDEAISMALEEDVSMALELELSLRVVEDRACHELDEVEAISLEEDCFTSFAMTLEEDGSSNSVSLAEALSLSQATSIAVKAKTPRENLAEFIKTSKIDLIGMNVKKVRIAADFFEAFEACDLTKATDDIEYALGNRIEP